MGLVAAVVVFIVGVGALDPQRLFQALLPGHTDIDVQAVEVAQRFIFELGLKFCGLNVAEGHKNGVAGVVVGAVEILELLVAQIGDVRRVAATVVVISRGGVQVLAHRLPQGAGNRAHRPLHFVEHHALVDEPAVGVVRFLEFDAVALLQEVQFLQTREEHRVQIDVQQVVEVLAVLAGERVGGPVRAGKRVHKRVERAANHHEERVPHGVALAATQRGMFEDMRHAGGIHGNRAQCDQKHVFVVIRRHVVVHGTGFAVAVFLDGDVEGFDGLASHPFESRVSGRGGSIHGGSSFLAGIGCRRLVFHNRLL